MDEPELNDRVAAILGSTQSARAFAAAVEDADAKRALARLVTAVDELARLVKDLAKEAS
jgi:hypothetical protein